VGIYPAVWHVTSGAHALGDLAIIATVTGLYLAYRLPTIGEPGRLAASFGVLTSAAAATKLSIAPLAGVLLILATAVVVKKSGVRAAVLVSGALPWLLFLLPITVWTWVRSGSPLGPILSPITGSSVYHPGEVEVFVRLTREWNQIALQEVLQESIVAVPLVVWAGVFAFFAIERQRLVSATAAFLLLGQMALILWLLPYQARFLGGLHYAFAILGVVLLARHAGKLKLWLSRLAAASLFPWLALQTYYGMPFLLAHREAGRHSFYHRYVPLFADLKALDELLPADATLLVAGWLGAPPSFYSPRRIVFDARDFRSTRNIFILIIESSSSPEELPPGVGPDALVYENNEANIATFRRPGAPANIGRISVYRLIVEVVEAGSESAEKRRAPGARAIQLRSDRPVF
jgi:hypothetical protein